MTLSAIKQRYIENKVPQQHNFIQKIQPQSLPTSKNSSPVRIRVTNIMSPKRTLESKLEKMKNDDGIIIVPNPKIYTRSPQPVEPTEYEREQNEIYQKLLKSNGSLEVFDKFKVTEKNIQNGNLKPDENMIKDLIQQMETQYVPKGILKLSEGIPNIRPCQLSEIGNFKSNFALVEISEDNDQPEKAVKFKKERPMSIKKIKKQIKMAKNKSKSRSRSPKLS